MNRLVVLRGYQFSVYNRIARVALMEKGVSYSIEEINPFTPRIPEEYLKLHPFRRVPVLSHGDFEIYETAAITQYIDDAFDGPKLMPTDAKSRARGTQVVSILDSYGYRPMVRQVFAHRVFRPALGERSEESEIARGLEDSKVVLDALNTLAQEGRVLNGRTVSIADCHAAPMIGYFVEAAEGQEALKKYSALADWWAAISQRRSIKETDPGLPPSEELGR